MDMDLVGADPSVLARIRKTIGTTFAEADEPHLGDVTLAAVELVTNAFEHGDGPRSIRMSHRRSPCLFELAVEDSNTVAPVMGRSRFGDDALRGRGLRLVDGLAKAWGVDVDAEKGTKTVWATISCPDSY
jgi:anti-sigma regulatory factor (Ser/Thr protein kinase)